MKMVADAAGVHVSTVSRALRRTGGRGEGMPEDVDRIVRIARELEYTPNPNAASLTTGRSTAFGVLVPHLTDIVLSAAYDAIEKTANKAGFDAFVANTHDDPNFQRARIDLLIGRQVDGLVIGDARLDAPELAEHLASTGIPTVLVNRRFPGLLSVTADDYGGGMLAAKHLAELGHSRIGVITGPLWTSTGYDRLDGFRAGLEQYGLELPDNLIVATGFGTSDGQVGMDHLLDSDPGLTGVFVCNDVAAIAAMGVLARRGLRPGHDVGIVGYNDIDISSTLTVPLTTIASPFTEMGRRACEMLLALVNDVPMSTTALPTRLVVRESTVPG